MVLLNGQLLMMMNLLELEFVLLILQKHSYTFHENFLNLILLVHILHLQYRKIRVQL